ncbi:putative 3-beta-hydroxysteroid-Delta(8),Delta(7)-isomerase [Hypsibius exemplaris]|uniref:3-beta-hydroxysteroid-Delta(8),Delta(7)-isomerase n=1 Tax=Hypsibius exemplaris TaxID=2072580 RepID=A0A1W0X194_HYPEX|nr:putative 3-beta-hydroxysteroid-Delta(8),Delta(7)-isomerase [Hypsibius exemplaris]
MSICGIFYRTIQQRRLLVQCFADVPFLSSDTVEIYPPLKFPTSCLLPFHFAAVQQEGNSKRRFSRTESGAESKMTKVPHPYLPAHLHLPNFLENSLTVEILLGAFGVTVAVVVVLAWNLAKRFRPDFSSLSRAKICWFAVSGIIHLVIEGYFAGYHKTLHASDSFLAQVWKEYAKGDSRYISSDTFTVVMETFTCVVDGPLCLWTAWAYLKNKPYVHVLQLLVSTAQFYGDFLYMAIEWVEGFVHGPQYHPLYFWGYFILMNSFWLIIPGLLMLESACFITKAVRLSGLTKVKNGPAAAKRSSHKSS